MDYIPGVQIRNANFRQQMVHQSSSCYVIKIKRVRVINWKRVCSVVLFCSLCQNLYRTKSIRVQHYILFSFEENCCWIIPITSRNSWLKCSIAKCAWTMVSVFQKWWLRGSRQGTWKITKKFENVELQGLLGEDDSQTQKQLAEQLNVNQQAVFSRYERWERFRRVPQ